jgi:hypothetical protein
VWDSVEAWRKKYGNFLESLSTAGATLAKYSYSGKPVAALGIKSHTTWFWTEVVIVFWTKLAGTKRLAQEQPDTTWCRNWSI